ncbi:restriction endonuclease fold toxin 5 of polymorphic toxin system [Trinickia symbiotica]|nr:restriction endonuclease fold toxin 5 domain-containing protein [Trinickia symbiotica]PPK41975.1 restriction endonuclease fold toxin 5 of polymorphic toxin system [Trinickia symbiotica]
MATIPLSGLEAAAIALAALLAAVAVDSAVRGTSDRASTDSDDLERDKAKSTTHALPIPDESREHCPPTRGRLVIRRWSMSDISREYQARITGFQPYTEWLFEIEFDGFRPQECRLQEAKGKYDQFFDSKTGLPEDFFVIFGGVGDMLDQARKQSDIVRSNPPAKLTWHFMQPISYTYFSREFQSEGLAIQSFLDP